MTCPGFFMRKFPGVSSFTMHYVPRRGPYKGWTITYTYFKARIMVRGKAIFLGHFQTPEEAAAAVVAAKKKAAQRGRPR